MATAPKKAPVLFSPVAVAPVPVAPVAAVIAEAAVPLTAVPFDNLAAPVRDMQEQLRQATETGLGESKATYARIKTAAEGATQSLEVSFAAARDGATAIGAKSVDALKANTEAGLNFFKSLAAAKSLTEAFELQTSFLRTQFETLSAQAKDLTALTQKVATDAVAPIKASAGKAFAHG